MSQQQQSVRDRLNNLRNTIDDNTLARAIMWTFGIYPELMHTWEWPRYNPPGLLIGPLPHVHGMTSNTWVPDYSHPGVSERVRIEVGWWHDMHDDKRSWM